MGKPARETGGNPVVVSASSSGAVRDWGYLALAYAPFFLNDFIFLGVDSVGGWLAIDYGSRVISLAIILGLPALRVHALKSDRRRCSQMLLIVLVATATLVVTVLFARLAPPLEAAVPAFDLFDFPRIEILWLRVFDVTLGLVFVAVTEELVGRRVTLAILRRRFESGLVIVVVSAALFSLMHWSHGVGSFVVAGIAGAIFMVVYMRTGSLVAVIAAHFLIDLIAFA